jgi:hypothetical protein
VRTRTATMRRDIVVSIESGTYVLDAPLQLSAAAGDSGENGHRVIYQAARYGGADPADVTVSGGRTITGWSRAGGGAWRADVGTLETRQLYVNGVRPERAKLGAGLPGRLTTTDTGYIVDSTVPQTWENPEDIELSYRFNGVWPEQALYFTEPRCGVAAITGDESSSMTTAPAGCSCTRRKTRRCRTTRSTTSRTPASRRRAPSSCPTSTAAAPESSTTSSSTR